MISISIRQVALAAAICGALPASAYAQAITLQRVGEVGATGISEDGRAVVGFLNGNNHVIRWTPETGVVQLGRDTYAQTKGGSGEPAISKDGTVISATILSNNGKHRTQGRWTTTGGWQQLGPYPADAAIIDREVSTAFGMSGDGSTVTGFYWSANARAHANTATVDGGTMGLPGNTTVSSRVDAANYDGTVLVGWEENPTFGGRQPAVWANGVRTFLENSDTGGEGVAVNAAGTIIVGQGYDPVRQSSAATMWKWNGISWDKQILGVLPGTTTGYSYATGVSDDGTIVVGFNRAKFNIFETRAFIWTAESGMRTVDQWLHSRGKDIKQKFDVRFVPAINGAGTAMVIIGEGKTPPYTRRSLVVRVKEGSGDRLGAN